MAYLKWASVNGGGECLRGGGGHDWIYVLPGRLRLVLGEEDFVEPGEAAEFSCRVPHWLRAVDARPRRWQSSAPWASGSTR